MWIEPANSNGVLKEHKLNQNLNKELLNSLPLRYSAYSIPLASTKSKSLVKYEKEIIFSGSKNVFLGLAANNFSDCSYQLDGKIKSSYSLNQYGLILFAERESAVYYPNKTFNHYEAAYTPAFYTRTSHSPEEGKIRELSILKGLLGWRRQNRRNHFMFLWFPIPLESAQNSLPGTYADAQNTLTLSNDGRFKRLKNGVFHSKGNFIVIDNDTLSLRASGDENRYEIKRQNDSFILGDAELDFQD